MIRARRSGTRGLPVTAQGGRVLRRRVAAAAVATFASTMLALFAASEQGVALDQATAFKKLIYTVEPYGQRHPRELFNEFMTTNNLRETETSAAATRL